MKKKPGIEQRSRNYIRAKRKRMILRSLFVYAAEHKNIEVVFDSTSGGLFSALADIMYKDNGFVGGLVLMIDFSVRQYISDDKCDCLSYAAVNICKVTVKVSISKYVNILNLVRKFLSVDVLVRWRL